ncbi:hypothetical protein I4641_01495 [Waterburya agarophytonicola K14]|uniref:Uncharacterized protein n=1 Tax=Waterburya agarophytonicola KI4 TaxID=2874699 RepID=A0A964BLM2_9CYAN|nr:hypothetical protein [Waterburya agarophytonicola]MCC0175654.1 hypothetical protein [Waterburya agarophytonicola KI4]
MYHKLLSLGIAAGILIPNIVLAEQKVIQQGSSSATAIGNNNRVSSRVYQSVTQNQNANNNGYINRQEQISLQEGHSNATVVGDNNLINTKINQNSIQIQERNYRNRDNQRSQQNAVIHGEAIGDNNRIMNSTGQYNRQNKWGY